MIHPTYVSTANGPTLTHLDILYIVAAGAAAASVFVAALRFFQYQRQRVFSRTAVRADGTVIDLVSGGGVWKMGIARDNLGFHNYSHGFGPTRTGFMFRGQVAHFPVVRFTAQDGRVVEFADTVGSAWSNPQKGDPVDVLYDPNHPRIAQIDGSGATLGRVIAGIALCLVIPGVMYALPLALTATSAGT